MTESNIDIKAESLPWQVKLIGALLIVAALSVLVNYWWLSIILVLVGLMLLTMHSGTQINVSDGTFREYNSYLFFRTGVTEKYNRIEKVFINSAKVSQKMYTPRTLSSSTFENIVFNAYLKFDDGRKIFLTSRENKDELIKILDPITTLLKVEITDNTLG
jgi:hypothetical protein